MTQDRLPHAGERDGLFYSTGYSGHGTQMSVLMGERMAAVMAGDAQANPWRGRDWPAIPGHFGPPWFLPAVGLYFRFKDRSAERTFDFSPHLEHRPGASTMTELQTLNSLVGPYESRRVMGALQRGATRRDILAMLMAGGMQIDVGRRPRRHGVSAHAQTPKRGGKHPGRRRNRGCDRHARSGQAVEPDRLLTRQHVLQRADVARRQPDTAARAGRVVHDQGCEDLGLQAAQGRAIPRRQAADAADVVFSISATRTRRRPRRPRCSPTRSRA